LSLLPASSRRSRRQSVAARDMVLREVAVVASLFGALAEKTPTEKSTGQGGKVERSEALLQQADVHLKVASKASSNDPAKSTARSESVPRSSRAEPRVHPLAHLRPRLPVHAYNGGLPQFYYWSPNLDHPKPSTVRLRWNKTLVRPGEGVVLEETAMGYMVNRPAHDGVYLVDGSYYIEVRRKSLFSKHGCCTEPFAGGWWHFSTPGSGIFLQVSKRVMDYTCPWWVVHAPDSSVETQWLRKTNVAGGFRSRFTGNGLWDRFTEDVELRCLRDWCTPAACHKTTFGDTNAGVWLNQPAHWKGDPPNYEQRLYREFEVTIAWWGLHGNSEYMSWGERGAKMVVDLRPTNLTQASYLNGSVHWSCPPQHHYYVATSDGRMKPCQCDSTQRALNCRQLEWQLRPSRRKDGQVRPAEEVGPLRVEAASANGSLCFNAVLCGEPVEQLVQRARKLIMQHDCAPAESHVLWPPRANETCPI